MRQRFLIFERALSTEIARMTLPISVNGLIFDSV